jgi:hypothetical protein
LSDLAAGPGLPGDPPVIAQTRRWVEQAVIGLNLCPFANAVLRKDQIEFRVSHASNRDALWQDLLQSIEGLLATPAARTDTLLLIHPWTLTDFFEFNDFVGDAEALLAQAGLEGILQIASFHPDYQFADVTADDPTNRTNRSPFPTLHLLREDSVDKAIASMQDIDNIVERNLQTMRRLGDEGWRDLQARIRNETGR